MGEAPIFREMEAVWFRSHGNDATAIFTRPRFDEPPAETSGVRASADGRAAALSSPTTPLPIRTPAVGGTAGPAQPPPPSYVPPAAQPASAPPAPPAPPAPAEPVAADADAWRTAADEGWSRASRAAEPADGGTTRSGLPKRVPQAQLVPGGIEPRGGREPSRRSPDDVRGLLSAYHRGVQRGRAAGTDQNHNSNKETR
ncbi:hypothetical protein E1211_24060 [Micromonospora sp. 15K316]|nr:hypothetical protein E1211_24060 [Micromonospora sp. 15K316]